MRVQRTRSSASAHRSPLTRNPVCGRLSSETSSESGSIGMGSRAFEGLRNTFLRKGDPKGKSWRST
jgi:hypothetical protein